ncbi:lysosomal alpha-mannosidase precursor [Trypanosoma grayi]|uniref:lysosomal alpha-mannosidase precursor n=1 Tax=Trypanosoma grayi TaxID=71804 RepID=UPI0004F45C91|nr:lysosomal alpha-mannosidase precursor [Trypanosoma grayi]KEG09759.1 lysosomal alpha-mannosidase precursor [Trypanosoma grayi]
MRHLAIFTVTFLLAVVMPVLPLLSSAKITVHLVPHTHDDMGWLKTVEQYQYGMNNTIQMANVNAIISSVVGGLLVNPERKFTYAEIGFFSRWWAEQTKQTREIVRGLVAEGRLQFANGGWSMHDEAATHFTDMIDQTTIGHRWLKRELNIVPRVGWQVDPFGHSATQGAMLTARAGLISTFFSRVDYQEDDYRGSTGRRQFWWQASPSMPELRTFAEINLHQTYCPPPHFSWDILGYWPKAQLDSETSEIVDDITSERYNVPLVLERFKAELQSNMNVTHGEHVMWTMGCDFHYLSSDLWYSNMDKLIKIVTADGEFSIRYSSPYEYTLAKLEEERQGLVYDKKKGDFFPYASAPHQFWTGYYTSRPTLKRLVRHLSSYWTAARQVEFLAGVPSGEVPMLSDALAIAQHHDAITGTAKQHVAFDYVKRLTAGYKNDFASRLRVALSLEPFGLRDAQHCLLSNVSVCPATASALARDGATLIVTVWNPSAHRVANALVRIPVPRDDVTVTGAGIKRYSVFESSLQVGDYTDENPGGLPYTLAVELLLDRLAVLTLSTPVSHAYAQRRRTSRFMAKTLDLESVAKVSNDALELHFGTNGLLETVIVRATGQKVMVVQDWCYFRSNEGDNESFISGGAYIMRPVTDSSCEPITTQPVRLSLVDGALGVIEQRFGNDLVQRVMLRGDVVDVEFTSLGIPIEDGFGRELVARFRTSVNNSGDFFTDSNGREMMRRRVDYRSDYPFTQTEPVAGNYYPVATLMFINDTQTQFSVFPDAPMGGTSIHNGEVLLTTHRRLLKDDDKGVGEALNETASVTSYAGCVPSNISACGHHYGEHLRVRGTLSFAVTGSAPTAMRRVREQQDEKYYTPLVVFSSSAAKASYDFSLGASLPPSLQLLTLQLLDERTLLLRIGHRYAVDEDPERSLPVKVNVTALLADVPRHTVRSVDEMSLMASEVVEPGVHTVTVKPMDIRTFICHLQLR